MTGLRGPLALLPATFCCLFAALQTRALPTPRCPGLWGRRGAALGQGDSAPCLRVGTENTDQALSPGLTTWVGFVLTKSGYSMPRLAFLPGGIVVSFLWARTCCELPTAGLPALHVLCSGVGLARVIAIKIKGRLGKKNPNKPNLFSIRIATRRTNSTSPLQ